MLLAALPLAAVSGAYLQPFSSRAVFASGPAAGTAPPQWARLNVSGVVQAASVAGASLLVSPGGVYTYNASSGALSGPVDLKLPRPATSVGGWAGCRTAPFGDSEAVVACPTGHARLTCRAAGGCAVAAAPLAGGLGAPVSAAAVSGGAANAQLWVGTRGGGMWVAEMPPSGALPPLAPLPAGSVERNASVSAVAWSRNLGELAVATEYKLWTKRGASPASAGWRYEWNMGVLDHAVSGLCYISLPLPVGEVLAAGAALALDVRWQNGTWDRFGWRGGLPVANSTAIACDSSSGSVWIGSPTGAAQWQPLAPHTPWRYYQGYRWLVGDAVASVAPMPGRHGGAVVVSDGGVAGIELRPYTLRQKADLMQSLVSPRHDRFGLTADCGLTRFGDPASWQPRSSDNDGLWTSIYLASQCFRYAVTREPEARAAAQRAMQGMQLLNNVTGVRGLMARSVLPRGDPAAQASGCGRPCCWRNSSTVPGFAWKCDTSGDEVIGHQFVFPLYHDLVAETDEERELARRLATDQVRYIIDNGFQLIDVTGQHTTWGFWDPKTLNDDPEAYDERGLYSLSILAWLASAGRLSNDSSFMARFSELADKHGYLRNVVNEKISAPDDFNFSDDEMAYLAFLTFYWALRQQPGLVPESAAGAFDRGLARQWRYSRPGLPYVSLWQLVAAGRAPANAPEAVADLQRFPTELVDWPTDNSRRPDVFADPDSDRFGRAASQATRPFPKDEATQLRWNGGPFSIRSGGGQEESDPGAFLLPYWLGRYLGAVPADA